MKRILLVFGIVTAVSSCQKSSVSPKQAAVNYVASSAWTVEKVQNAPDGDITVQYSNFSIVFNAKNSGTFNGEYFIANGGIAFPTAYGKWSLSDDLKTLTFDNGRTFQIDMSNSKLQLDFTYTSTTGGRLMGLSGQFTFLLKH